MRKLIYALVWAFVLFIPAENVIHLPPGLSLVRMLGTVSVALAVIVALITGRARAASRIHIYLLAALFWTILSYLWSVNQGLTVTAIKQYLQLAGLVFLIYEYGHSEGDRANFIKAYLIGACVIAFGTWHSFVTNSSAYGDRYVAANYDPNIAGMTFAIGVVMAWYLHLRTETRLKWLYAAFIPVASVAVLLTASRGAFATLLVALIIIPATASYNRRGTVAATALVLAALSFVLLRGLVPQSSWQRVAGTWSEIRAGEMSGRRAEWSVGWSVFKESPVVGVGTGAFRAATGRKGSFGLAHNVYLTFLAEGGIIGFALFAGTVLTVLSQILRLAPPRKAFYIVVFATTGVSMLSSPMEWSKVVWFVFALAAAECGEGFRIQDSGFRGREGHDED